MKKAHRGGNNKKKGVQVVDQDKRELINECKNTEDINVILEYTEHKDNDVRLEAVKQLCPCKVLRDIEIFWDRVFELVDDEDARIRSRILHIICDGSPQRLEDRVYSALKEFNRDSDSQIRRTAHKVIAHYEHTGKWNIL